MKVRIRMATLEAEGSGEDLAAAFRSFMGRGLAAQRAVDALTAPPATEAPAGEPSSPASAPASEGEPARCRRCRNVMTHGERDICSRCRAEPLGR